MIDLFAGLIAAVRIDAARVRRNIDASCITITELADTLVREEGLSFRQAHEIAARVGREVTAQRASLSEAGFAPFAEAFRDAAGRTSRLDASSFVATVSPERFVSVRARFGGPAPAALDAAFDRYAQRLAEHRSVASAGADRERIAAGKLDAAFSALLEA